jgi:hypothetical protein
MGILETIRGPKSKYDRSLPYTYEARVRIFEEGDAFNAYFADTICGLLDYLREKDLRPEVVEILEIYADKEFPLDPQLLTTADGAWLSKPDICRAFEAHYPGHIQPTSCSFEDRDCCGTGP